MRFPIGILLISIMLSITLASSPAVAQTTLLGGNIVNQTWTLAGSPYTVRGDVTVPAGAFLRVQAGVEVRFADSDAQASGRDRSLVELTVDGTLTVNGTAAEPVRFHAESGTGTRWYGIRASAGSSVEVNGASISNARYGIVFEGDGTVSRSTFSNCGIGVGMYGGTATIDSSVITTTSQGVYASSGSLTVRNCTLVGNSLYGVHALGGNVVVLGSIVTSNRSYGLARSAGTLTYSDTDVWDNGVLDATDRGGNISANPQFVGALDFHLMGSSVCIDAAGSSGAPLDFDGSARPADGDGIGGAAWDMGAYEFVLPAVCGDGAVGTGEVCDDGDSNGTYGFCNADCSDVGPHCGDATTNGPETCDDGNAIDTDACLNTCVLARCGDGVTQAGVEECDDGNDSNLDACTGTCMHAVCGDGYVGPDEECDDGNTEDADGCSNGCVRQEESRDAGVNDGGIVDADAGASDAGASDAGPFDTDAASTPDAGTGAVSVAGGCGCRANHPSGGGFAALLGLALVLARRRWCTRPRSF